MADNGGCHAANGGGHAAGVASNGGHHALAVPVAAANASEENEGDQAANGGDRAAGMAGGAGAVALALRIIPKEALRQVLPRSLVAEVARCRTLSWLWRDVPSKQAFREDRHLGQGRSMPLFFYRPDDQAEPLDGVVRVNLHAVDIRGRTSHPIMRFASQDPVADDPRVFRIEGSCDGILLTSYDTRFFAFNPCTRCIARLPPPLHELGDIIGFYEGGLPHDREYRVLFHMNAGCPNWDHRYWVMSLSSPGNPIRYLSTQPADLGAVGLVLASGISPSFEMPPVVVGDFLYWLPQARQGNSYLLAFNSVDEVFNWIPPTMVQEGDRMVQVDGDQLLETNGRLAITLVGRTSVEVWLLHHNPYIGGAWVWTYQILLPEAAIQDHHGYDGEALCAAVFVVSEGRNVLVQCTHAILQCDAMGDCATDIPTCW